MDNWDSERKKATELTTTGDKVVLVTPATGIDKLLSYRVPEELADRISVGLRVLIPLGRRKVTGYVVSIRGKKSPANNPPSNLELSVNDVSYYRGKLKDIIDILDSEPLFDADALTFFQFLSNYYLAPLGEVIRTALPKGINLKSVKRIRAVKGTVGRTDTEREILALVGDGSISLELLKKRLPDVAVNHYVEKLTGDGLLEMDEVIEGGRVKRGTIEVVALARGIDLDDIRERLSRSPKARGIIDFIANEGNVHREALKERFGDVTKQVKRLEEMGAIIRDSLYRDRDIQMPDMAVGEVSTLSPAQEGALSQIGTSIDSGEFRTYLLYGVTGSGKTEVYLRAVKRGLEMGRGAIVLVPEIALTPQLMNRFMGRLGDTVAVLHSSLSDGERLDQWWRVKTKKARVVMGARSSLFAPMEDLGVIVVDEEHEPSYKQGEVPRYNARDAAVMLGKLKGATVILGSATPSLESYHNAKTGRFELVSLPDRITGKEMPGVEIVDMKEAPFVTKSITERLAQEIERTVKARRQGILLLNRRGFSSFILCPVCGHKFQCPSCSITLTYHRGSRSLKCHYCDYRMNPPDYCPECESKKLIPMGTGTERIEEEIDEIVPGARVLRLDRDTTRKKGAMMDILSAFSRLEADILLGTQMVAKGHDFPEVDLVGVINADVALNLPDFRSGERTFSLLTQAAGRAGRGKEDSNPSKVIIQTYNPEHYAIVAASSHDYGSFLESELGAREELMYPPFSRLVLIRLSGSREERVKGAAETIMKRAVGIKEKGGLSVSVLGPVASPLSKIKGNYRYQILIKGANRTAVVEMLKRLLRDRERYTRGGVRLSIDIDPIDML